MGDLRVEHNLFGEFAQPGLNIPRGGIAVTCENITPVSLAVYQKAFLAELDESAEDGGVSVRVVLHGLADYVRHLGVATVVHLVHRVQHTPLDRFETVHYVRHGPLEYDIRGIVQEPVLEHSRQLKLVTVRA